MVGVSGRWSEIRRLRRERPRSRFLRASAFVGAGLFVYAWFFSEITVGGIFSAQGRRNLDRFLRRVRPPELRDTDWDWGVAWNWGAEIMRDTGAEAAWITLAIAVAAIVMAGSLGLLTSFFAARTVATPEPFLPSGRRPGRFARYGWAAVVFATRAFFVLIRSIPEYIWAFMLVIVFGNAAWAAVLALGLHNWGILGKLHAETLESVPASTPAALRGLGAHRSAVTAYGLLPSTQNRFLLFFFYRWETCVRTAAILGLLNIESLGYWISQAYEASGYATMFFLVLIAAVMVLVGDAISAIARALIRRA